MEHYQRPDNTQADALWDAAASLFQKYANECHIELGEDYTPGAVGIGEQTRVSLAARPNMDTCQVLFIERTSDSADTDIIAVRHLGSIENQVHTFRRDLANGSTTYSSRYPTSNADILEELLEEITTAEWDDPKASPELPLLPKRSNECTKQSSQPLCRPVRPQRLGRCCLRQAH